MSLETYETALYDAEVYRKLKEAELEMKSGIPVKSHEVVFGGLDARYAIKNEK